MSMRRRIFIGVVGAAILALCPGCGGGSSGTGGQRYEGQVVVRSGQPAAGVEVRLDATGDRTITSADGSFVIETDRLSGDVPFTITSASVSASTIVRDVPAEASVVSVTFELDEARSSVETTRVEVRRRDDDDNDDDQDDDDDEGRDDEDDDPAGSDDDREDDDSSGHHDDDPDLDDDSPGDEGMGGPDDDNDSPDDEAGDDDELDPDGDGDSPGPDDPNEPDEPDEPDDPDDPEGEEEDD